MTGSKDKELTTSEGRRVTAHPETRSITLSSGRSIDATGLTESQVAELRLEYASGVLDLEKKAAELQIEVDALNAHLTMFNDKATEANDAGIHSTFSHTQTTSTGRTEIVMGNTGRAQSGRISRSAAGEQNQTLIYVIIGAVAAIIIAAIVAG